METITVTRIKQTKRGAFALFCRGRIFVQRGQRDLFAERLEEARGLSRPSWTGCGPKATPARQRIKALQYLSLRDYASGELYDKLCLKLTLTLRLRQWRKWTAGPVERRGVCRPGRNICWGRTSPAARSPGIWRKKGVDRAIVDAVLARFYEDAVCGGEELPPDAAAPAARGKSYGRRLAEEAGKTCWPPWRGRAFRCRTRGRPLSAGSRRTRRGSEGAGPRWTLPPSVLQ